MKDEKVSPAPRAKWLRDLSGYRKSDGTVFRVWNAHVLYYHWWAEQKKERKP